jgi:uncharacterized membrane protein
MMATSPPTRPPTWIKFACFGLALGGVGIAAYLTAAHYASPSVLACPDTGVVNCTLVTTSPESMILGIPVAVVGLVWALVMTGLCSPWAWGRKGGPADRARLVLATAGAVAVVYLVYTELFRIGAICLWCTAMHAVTIGLFGLVLVSRVDAGLPAPDPAQVKRANRSAPSESRRTR